MDAALQSAVAACFSAADVPAALELLTRYGDAPHEREPQRVRHALVTASDGDLTKLARLLAVAKTDYRDVLAGPLTAPEGEAARAAANAILERWGKKE